jgi:hypothetical protein
MYCVSAIGLLFARWLGIGTPCDALPQLRVGATNLGLLFVPEDKVTACESPSSG